MEDKIVSDTPKIDILLTTYNGEKYLEEQIESILNQSYTHIQLIISDDGSTDRTREILKKYEKNSKITIYYQEKNLGYIRNFEFLLTKVENELYMLSDQDDVWKPNKIQDTLKKLEEENADLVFTDLEVVNENLELINTSFNRSMNKEHKIKKTIDTKQFEYLYNNITGCTIMSKKKWINEILPIPKNSKYVIHDSWIGLIISLNGKVTYLDKPTIQYRQHGDNQIGTEKASYKCKEFKEVRELFINVKKDLFKTYLENQEKFPEDLQKLNEQGKAYFDNIEKKKYINFRNWTTFYKLYQYETLSYYVLNLIILNIPVLGKCLFAMRKLVKNIIYFVRNI